MEVIDTKEHLGVEKKVLVDVIGVGEEGNVGHAGVVEVEVMEDTGMRGEAGPDEARMDLAELQQDVTIVKQSNDSVR